MSVLWGDLFHRLFELEMVVLIKHCLTFWTSHFYEGDTMRVDLAPFLVVAFADGSQWCNSENAFKVAWACHTLWRLVLKTGNDAIICFCCAPYFSATGICSCNVGSCMWMESSCCSSTPSQPPNQWSDITLCGSWRWLQADSTKGCGRSCGLRALTFKPKWMGY